MMDNQSVQPFSTLSDSDLNQYITNYWRYSIDTVEAVVAELRTRGRNISAQELDSMRNIISRQTSSDFNNASGPKQAEQRTIEPSSTGELVLFTERAISGATFLGGPLAATYLIAHNFKAIGNDLASKRTWIIGILITLIVVPVLMSLPEHVVNRSTTTLLEFLWVLPAYVVVHKLQQTDIESHLAAGGPKGSPWKAAGVGLVSLTVYLAYLGAFAYATLPPPLSPIPDFQRASVRMEYSGCTVYYDSIAISSSDAKVAGAILEKVGYFDAHVPELDALFYKSDKEYIIAFGLAPEALHNSLVENPLKAALNDLHEAYRDRHYAFRLFAMDSTGITAEHFIRLN
jgi:hypothetical protein